MEQCGIHLGRPSVRNRVLRALAPAGLSFALTASMAANPAIAFADSEHVYESASVSLQQYYSNVNADATFDAYKVFDADIDNGNKASHIQWASEAAKTATLAFFDSLSGQESYATWLAANGYTQADAHDNAQNAAEFIAERIAGDDDIGTWTGYNGANGPAKAGGSFTDRLARAVAGADPAVPHLTSTSTASRKHLISGGTEGYYLIVTSPLSIGVSESGIAPMWIPMGGSLVSVQAKEAGANLLFSVWEDRVAARGGIADSNIGQDVHYEATGSYPGNIAAYSRYSDSYAFTIPEGLTTKTGTSSAKLNPSDFQVILSGSYKADGATEEVGQVINGYDGVSLSANGTQMTVSLDDVRAVAAALSERYPDFTPTSLTIAYEAHLNSDAVIGPTGQRSSVLRTYTADPVSLATTTSRNFRLNHTTYQANFTKVDKSNHQPLAGAGFFITAETDVTADQLDASKQEGDPVYVQADGSLGVTPYEFITDDKGEFSVRGIDEGVYTVHENTVPSGYMAPDSDAVLTIESTLDQGTSKASFSAKLEGGEGVEVEGDAATEITSIYALDGFANVQISNEKAFVMPYTGLEGNDGLYAMAAALGASGAGIVYVGSRRNRGKAGKA